MEKIIDFRSEFENQAPDFGMTNEHGLFLPEYRPVFSRSFEKHASNVYVPDKIQSYIHKLKPRPSEGRYVHLIALGSFEFWGPNRKGDSFPKWSLLGEAAPETLSHTLQSNPDPKISKVPSRDKYGLSTFETNPAYAFRNHKNSNPRFTTGEAVSCAAYNEKMERVELIVFIKDSLAPEIVTQIDNGEPIPWSMGCRVPFDVCSICGHVARTTRDYCQHTRHGGLGSFDRETGRRVSVYNYYPSFFDISHVFVPADRSAFMLQKVAAASDHKPILSINIPFAKAAANKRAMIKKTVPLEGHATDLGVDPLDPKEVKESVKLVNDDKDKKDIPKGFLEKLKNLFGGEASAKGMTSAGIVMKPNEADTLLGGCRMGRGSGPLSPLPSGLMKMIGGLISGRSMFRSAITPRVKRIRIIIMGKKPTTAATSSDEKINMVSLKDLKKDDKKMSKSASSYYQWLEGLDSKEVWDSAVENLVIDKLEPNFFAEKIASIYVESEPQHDVGFFLPFIIEVERLKENF